MAYSRTTWVNEETQLNARNMNNIEDGIQEAMAEAADAAAKTADVTKMEIDLLSGKSSNNLRRITAGTTDLTAGVSSLTTDAIYLVYEA